MDWVGTFLMVLLNVWNWNSAQNSQRNELQLQQGPTRLDLSVNFKGLGSQRCLEALNGDIVIGDCLTNANKQLWMFKASSYQFREYTSFRNGASFQCLGTVSRDQIASGSSVGLVTCDSQNQDPQSGAHWRLVRNNDPDFSNDAYKILQMKSGKCLTVANGNTGNGAKLIIVNRGSDAQNQLWDMTHAKYNIGG